jgi:ferrochelatase
MASDGVGKALAFVTSAYGSYSGCRRYLEDMDSAREAIGGDAPFLDKVRLFYNHPLFVEANAEKVRGALESLPAPRRPRAEVVFTAHSIPTARAQGSPYEEQFHETGRLVAERLGLRNCSYAYQSRSGAPQQPWLEPDVCDRVRVLAGQGVQDVVAAPIGFVSDHIEVLYDLGVEAREVCRELGVGMTLAGTAGDHPLFVEMAGELVEERVRQGTERRAVGRFGAWPDRCPDDCCRLPDQKSRQSPRPRERASSSRRT